MLPHLRSARPLTTSAVSRARTTRRSVCATRMTGASWRCAALAVRARLDALGRQQEPHPLRRELRHLQRVSPRVGDGLHRRRLQHSQDLRAPLPIATVAPSPVASKREHLRAHVREAGVPHPSRGRLDSFDPFHRYTQAKVRERGLETRVSLVRGSGRALPFADNTSQPRIASERRRSLGCLTVRANLLASQGGRPRRGERHRLAHDACGALRA